MHFPNPNALEEFTLTVQPDEGYWRQGRFKFSVYVPEEYNMTVRIYNNMIKLYSAQTFNKPIISF